MKRLLAAAASLLLFATVHAAQRTTVPASLDLVEIDVAVADRQGKPVTGLTANDFTVKDDGARVEIKTFMEARPTTPGDPDNLRSVVLLLDDVAVPASGTLTMQVIAKAFLLSADPRDELSVIRLHNRSDEAFGDRSVTESRILQFQAAAFPFADFNTASDTLSRVAEVSRQLADDDHRRKAIVCVGTPIVCNIDEPASSSVRPRHWSSWVDAVSASAKANAAVYAIIPGRTMRRSGGLADLTGGEVFVTNYDVGPPIDRIMQDASSYYMLGYWPTGKSRELHAIDVKVAKGGLKVHARRRRGN
jgi:Ca-activated chloride channel homolog